MDVKNVVEHGEYGTDKNAEQSRFNRSHRCQLLIVIHVKLLSLSMNSLSCSSFTSNGWFESRLEVHKLKPTVFLGHPTSPFLNVVLLSILFAYCLQYIASFFISSNMFLVSSVLLISSLCNLSLKFTPSSDIEILMRAVSILLVILSHNSYFTFKTQTSFAHNIT